MARYLLCKRTVQTRPMQGGTTTTMGGITMLDMLGKLLDIIEEALAKEDATDPVNNDKLVAFAARLEALAMELKDRTE